MATIFHVVTVIGSRLACCQAAKGKPLGEPEQCQLELRIADSDAKGTQSYEAWTPFNLSGAHADIATQLTYIVPAKRGSADNSEFEPYLPSIQGRRPLRYLAESRSGDPDALTAALKADRAPDDTVAEAAEQAIIHNNWKLAQRLWDRGDFKQFDNKTLGEIFAWSLTNTSKTHHGTELLEFLLQKHPAFVQQRIAIPDSFSGDGKLRNPLCIANKFENTEVSDLLRKYGANAAQNECVEK